MYQNNFQPHTLLRRETLLLDLRDVIEENIQPLVSRARTELNTIPSGKKFSNYMTSGLLAEAIERLGKDAPQRALLVQPAAPTGMRSVTRTVELDNSRGVRVRLPLQHDFSQMVEHVKWTLGLN